MATLVCFHAHPDDEAIATGGVMAKAADEGHRVVLVLATRGELGEVADGFLEPEELLWQRRVVETHAAADVLGARRVEFLGYLDSGMAGEATNDEPGSFWSADVEEAAERLAAILREEQADVFTCYDPNGVYGHPDHVQVHRVGMRAAELAGVERVYQSTMNRDHLNRLRREASGFPDAPPELADGEDFGEGFGVTDDEVTAMVDVTAYVDRKRAAMRAHASQIGDEHFMLTMPDAAFRGAFGVEWFMREGQGPGITETDLMDGLS